MIQRRHIPQPVLKARQALAILDEQGVEINPKARKALPAYAMRLEQEGKEIDIDFLVNIARAPEQLFAFSSKSQIHKKQTPIERYQEIINGLDPYKHKTPNEQLITAIERNNKDRILDAINKGADVTFSYNSALRLAARYGHTEIIKLLMAFDEVDVTTNDNGALKLAAYCGYTEIIKLLMTRGEVDITAEDNCALRVAAQNGHTEIVKLLMARNEIDVTVENNEALRKAAQNGHTEIVKLLMTRDEVDVTAYNNEALKLAAQNGHTEIVKSLMARDEVDIAVEDNFALRWATENGHTEIVKLLIACDEVDVTANDNYALRKAAYNGHTEIVKLLMACDEVDVTADGNYALRWAAYSGYTEIVKLLMARDEVDITADDNYALKLAAQNGHIEIVKLLMARDEVDITAEDNFALRLAAYNGHIEIVKLLMACDEVDVTAEDNFALRLAAYNGHIEIVKLLMARDEVDVTADDNYALKLAAKYGHTEVVKSLMACDDVDVTADDNYALKLVAQNGHIEIVKLLIARDEVDVTAEDNFALKVAAGNGHIEIVKLLMASDEVDVTAEDNEALRWAAGNGHMDIAHLLIQNGASREVLIDNQARDYDAYAKWMKIVRRQAPEGIQLENPTFFKQGTFDLIFSLLDQEGYIGAHANKIAFHVAALLGAPERVFEYLQKWGQPGKQPLHDIIQMIKMPDSTEINLKDWGDAVLKCGPSMAKLVAFGDKLTSPIKSSDGRTWSMINTRNSCAQFAYKKANQHRELANFCFTQLIDEKRFNEALKIIQNTKSNKRKRLPDIYIDGARFEMENVHLKLLASDDFRGLFLGELTDCCQSIGCAGEDCAEHGYISKHSGFYVIENSKGQVLGQSWVWRGDNNELCFDSLETLGTRITGAQWSKILQEFATELEQQKDAHDVTSLHIGLGGATPKKALKRQFNTASSNKASPKKYKGYRDSDDSQLMIWRRKELKKTLS